MLHSNGQAWTLPGHRKNSKPENARPELVEGSSARFVERVQGIVNVVIAIGNDTRLIKTRIAYQIPGSSLFVRLAYS
jgi:hypothetical protein